jgi:hypothetical protein
MGMYARKVYIASYSRVIQEDCAKALRISVAYRRESLY